MPLTSPARAAGHPERRPRTRGAHATGLLSPSLIECGADT